MTTQSTLLQALEACWDCQKGTRYWGELIQGKEPSSYSVNGISVFGRQGSLSIPSDMTDFLLCGKVLRYLKIDGSDISRKPMEKHLHEKVEFDLKVVSAGDKYVILATNLRFLTEDEVALAESTSLSIDKLVQREEDEKKSLEDLQFNVLLEQETLGKLGESLNEAKKKNLELEKEDRELRQSIAGLQQRLDWFRQAGLLPEEDAPKPHRAEKKDGGFSFDARPDEVDWKDALRRVGACIAGQGGIFPAAFLENFMALMRTHDMVVLAGRSGTGKTSFCRLFAQAVGACVTIVPVKPNWVSSDDLLGYVNPVDKSYVTTPFVEALAEARRSPKKLHLIVLDEMNIARPEYYLADLLSVLEDRSSRELLVGRTGTIRRTGRGAAQYAAISRLLSALQSSKEKPLPTPDELIDKHRPALAKALSCKVSEVEETLLRMACDEPGEASPADEDIIVPDNVRIIGTINIDETTNFFSPKVLDRIFLVRLDDPLSVPEEERCRGSGGACPMSARCFGERAPYPKYDKTAPVAARLYEISALMRRLGIDISLRVMRQAMHYAVMLRSFTDENETAFINVVRSKLMPRMVFDADEASGGGNGRRRRDELESVAGFMEKRFRDRALSGECRALLEQARSGDHQVNYWTL